MMQIVTNILSLLLTVSLSYVGVIASLSVWLTRERYLSIVHPSIFNAGNDSNTEVGVAVYNQLSVIEKSFLSLTIIHHNYFKSINYHLFRLLIDVLVMGGAFIGWWVLT